SRPATSLPCAASPCGTARSREAGSTWCWCRWLLFSRAFHRRTYFPLSSAPLSSCRTQSRPFLALRFGGKSSTSLVGRTIKAVNEEDTLPRARAGGVERRERLECLECSSGGGRTTAHTGGDSQPAGRHAELRPGA